MIGTSLRQAAQGVLLCAVLCTAARAERPAACETGSLLGQRHPSCARDSLNTYQVADCEKIYADAAFQAMNEVYARLLKVAEDHFFSPELKASQEAYLRFVDAEATLSDDYSGGTMGTYLYEQCRTALFDERRSRLQEILEEYEPGEQKTR